MTLSLDGKGISVERFFGDIHLPGTGLSGSAAVSATLRWTEGGIARSSGARAIAIAPGPASSIVRGRFGVPIGGGGDLPIVDGRIGFEGTRVPFLRFHARSDRRPADRPVAAGLRLSPEVARPRRVRPHLPELPGGLGRHVLAPRARRIGRGRRPHREVVGRPRGDRPVLGRERALRRRRVRQRPRRRRHARRRVPVPSAAHLRGKRDDLARRDDALPQGSEAAGLRLRADREGLPDLAPARVPGPRLPDRGEADGKLPDRRKPARRRLGLGRRGARRRGVLGADGAAPDRTHGPLARDTSSSTTCGPSSAAAASEAASRSATRRRRSRPAPRATVCRSNRCRRCPASAATFRAASPSRSADRAPSPSPTSPPRRRSRRRAFFGRPIPEDRSPRLALRVTHGVVDGTVSVPGHATLTAKGDAGATPIVLDVGLDAPDLAALLAFTPATLPAGDGGALAARGRVTLPSGKDEWPSAQFVVTEARLDARDRKGLVRSDGDFSVSLEGRRIALGDLHAVGDGVDVRLRGAVDLSGEKATLEARATGSADASVLGLVAPDLGLGGRFVVDLVASGPASEPGSQRDGAPRGRPLPHGRATRSTTSRGRSGCSGLPGRSRACARRSATARRSFRAASGSPERGSRTFTSRPRAAASAFAPFRPCG